MKTLLAICFAASVVTAQVVYQETDAQRSNRFVRLGWTSDGTAWQAPAAPPAVTNANPRYKAFTNAAFIAITYSLDLSKTADEISDQLIALDPLGTNGLIQQRSLILLKDLGTGKLQLDAAGHIVPQSPIIITTP